MARPVLRGVHRCASLVRDAFATHHAGYVAAVAADDGTPDLAPAVTFRVATPGSLPDEHRGPLQGWPIIFVDPNGHGPPSRVRRGDAERYEMVVQLAVEVWTHLTDAHLHTEVERRCQQLLAAIVTQLVDEPGCGDPDHLRVRLDSMTALLSEPWTPLDGGVACRARIALEVDWSVDLTREALVAAPINPTTVTVTLLED